MKLVSAKKIAEHCGEEITPRMVLRWAKEGRIPSVRINQRVIRFDKDEVRKALLRK